MLNYTLPDFIDIPTFVYKIRKDKKYSQIKLGKKLGVTGKAVSTYERGINVPSLDVFFKLIFIGGYALECKKSIYKTPKRLTIPSSSSSKSSFTLPTSASSTK